MDLQFYILYIAYQILQTLVIHCMKKKIIKQSLIAHFFTALAD